MSFCIRRRIEPALMLTGIAALFVVGCQQEVSREAQKPVIEESTADRVDESFDEAADAASDAANQASEAASDAADAVTPDEPIVDIQTPLGDVRVGRDPITDDTNVDVETPRTDVDVDSGS